MEITQNSLNVTRNLAHKISEARRKLEIYQLRDHRLKLATRALERIQRRVLRPLRVAVLGDVNSGKSSLVNILVTKISLPTGAVTSTRIPTLVHFSPQPSLTVVLNDRRVVPVNSSVMGQPQNIFRLNVGLPDENLRFIEYLDCPGVSTLEMDGGHFDIAEHHVDGAIWCTLATAAWRESEASAWQDLPGRIRSRGLLVVTRRDQLRETQLQQVRSRLLYEVDGLFSHMAFIAMKQANKAVRDSGFDNEVDKRLWALSGAQDFQRKLETLCANIRYERAEAAWIVTMRLAHRTLNRIKLLA